jgi:hypothetical protein
VHVGADAGHGVTSMAYRCVAAGGTAPHGGRVVRWARGSGPTTATRIACGGYVRKCTHLRSNRQMQNRRR